MLERNKIALWKTCIIFFIWALLPLFIFNYRRTGNPLGIYNIKNHHNHTMNNNLNNIDLNNPETYYIQAGELTTFVKNNFLELLKKYPEKYQFLSEKLNEYDEEMIIKEEDKEQGQVLYIKGLYNLKFAEEIFDLIEQSGLTDKDIIEDFNNLEITLLEPY